MPFFEYKLNMQPSNLIKSSSQAYTQLPDDAEGSVYTQRSSRLSPLLRTIAFLIVLPLFFLLGFFSKSFATPHGHTRNGPLSKPIRCPQDPGLAKEFGCKFDMISFSWLPPQCFDTELTDEWNRLHTFPYYTDMNGTAEIPQAEAHLGKRDVYSTWEQHLHHCMFMWRKYHRAIERGGMTDDESGGYHHTTHCVGIVQEAWEGGLPEDDYMCPDIKEINTHVVIKYPECR